MKEIAKLQKAIFNCKNTGNEWAAQLIQEFILANTEVKVGKLDPWKWVAPKNDCRIAMRGIFYNDARKEAVATDTHILLISKSLYREIEGNVLKMANSKEVGKILMKNGSTMDKGVYPNYPRVIPDNCVKVECISREEMAVALKAIAAYNKTCYSKPRYSAVKIAEGVYMGDENVKRMLTIPGELNLSQGGYGQVKHEDDDITAIFMPIASDKWEKIGEHAYVSC